jgi:HAD superfamily phosphatase (TIGR01668 family)
MQASRKTVQNSKATGLVPDYFADSVRDIDFKRLHARGIRYLVLDVDHTLVHYRAMEIDAPTAQFLHEQRECGLVAGIYIASNSRRDLSAIADALDATIIRPSRFKRRKPRPHFFSAVVRAIGCKPEQAVMVGDKLVMDIWGANRCGMYSVLVSPIGQDMLFDRIIRRRFWNKQYLRRKRR